MVDIKESGFWEKSDLLEPKLWIGNLSKFVKFLFLVLLIVGFGLIFVSFRYKNELEEFFGIPFLMGILDLILSFFLIFKNIGYKVYFTGNYLIISKFTKEICKVKVKEVNFSFKKRFFYDVLEFYNQGKLVFILYSYWFSNKDFISIKEVLMSLNKYFKNQ